MSNTPTLETLATDNGWALTRGLDGTELRYEIVRIMGGYSYVSLSLDSHRPGPHSVPHVRISAEPLRNTDMSGTLRHISAMDRAYKAAETFQQAINEDVAQHLPAKRKSTGPFRF